MLKADDEYVALVVSHRVAAERLKVINEQMVMMEFENWRLAKDPLRISYAVPTHPTRHSRNPACHSRTSHAVLRYLTFTLHHQPSSMQNMTEAKYRSHHGH